MGLFKRIADFHKDLIDTSTPSSYRNFLGIVFAYSVVFTAFVDLFTKLSMTSSVFIALCTMALTYAGLTTWTANIKANNEDKK